MEAKTNMTKDELVKLVKELLNDYYITVGLLRFVADEELEKLYLQVKECRNSGKWKMWIKKAYEQSKKTNICEWLKKYNAEFELYKRVLEKVPHELNMQLLFIKIAISNYVVNSTEDLQDIKSDLIYTLVLYEMVVKLHLSFVDGETQKYGKIVGGALKRTLEQFTLVNVVPPLQASVVSLFNKIPQIQLKNAEQAMLNKLANVEWVNKIVYDSMIEKGGYENVIQEFDKEEDERERKELGIDKLLEKYRK